MSGGKIKTKEKDSVKTATPQKSSHKYDKSWPTYGNHKDDLQMIHGIGLATETALNRIGIVRFQDFAKYSPKTLAEELENKTGISISDSDISKKDWFGQATKFAAERGSGHSAEKIDDINLSGPDVQQKKASIKTDRTDKTNKPSERKQQVEEAVIAKSQVSDIPKTAGEAKEPNKPHMATSKKNSNHQQTASKKKTKAETSTKKSNSKQSNKQASKRVTKDEKLKKTTSAATKEEPDILNKISIKKVEFKQVFANGSARNALTGRVKFHLDNSQELKRMVGPINVQIHALNQAKRNTQILAADSIRPKKSKEYEVMLNCDIPTIGNYRLMAVVLSLDSDGTIDICDGPSLRILP